jgi:hypothetical protein
MRALTARAMLPTGFEAISYISARAARKTAAPG